MANKQQQEESLKRRYLVLVIMQRTDSPVTTRYVQHVLKQPMWDGALRRRSRKLVYDLSINATNDDLVKLEKKKLVVKSYMRDVSSFRGRETAQKRSVWTLTETGLEAKLADVK